MTDISRIMPMLMLGQNVSDNLKTAFMMEAFVKGRQGQRLASFMQAKEAGEESRRRNTLAEEKGASVELLTDLVIHQIEKAPKPKTDTGAVISATIDRSKIKAAVTKSLTNYTSKSSDDRSAAVFLETLGKNGVTIPETVVTPPPAGDDGQEDADGDAEGDGKTN